MCYDEVMFTPAVRFGERVALIDPAGAAPRLPATLLLPGPGRSFAERLAQAVPARDGGTSRPGAGERVLADAPVVAPPAPSAVDAAVFAARCADPAQARWADAQLQVAQWRSTLAQTPPGPARWALLASRPAVLTERPGQQPWDDGGMRWANARVDALGARAGLIAHLQAEQYRDLAGLAHDYPGLREMLGSEVALALSVSEATADGMLATAESLTRRLPATLAAFDAGRIGETHVKAVLTATRTSNARVAGQVDAEVTADTVANGWRAEQVRRAAVRAVIRIDADGANTRHRKAVEDRAVTRWKLPDGMAALKVVTAAPDVVTIWEALTGLADAARAPADPRSLGARRVDSLVGLCAGVLDGSVGITEPAPGGPATTRLATSGYATTELATTELATTELATTELATTESATNESATKELASSALATTEPAVAEPCAPRVGSNGVDLQAAAADQEQPPAPISGCSCSSADAGSVRVRPLRLGKRRKQLPQVKVTMPLSALLGVGPGAQAPCELDGWGPITAEQARLIASDAELRRMVTDPLSGTLLDYGRTRYQPPETLASFVIARDVTCAVPGCLEPAGRAQLDHLEPFRPGHPDGGHTCAANLAPLDLHHHRGKDGGGATLTRHPDGSYTWTTPLGRSYTQPPTRLHYPSDPVPPADHHGHLDTDDDAAARSNDRPPPPIERAHRPYGDDGRYDDGGHGNAGGGVTQGGTAADRDDDRDDPWHDDDASYEDGGSRGRDANDQTPERALGADDPTPQRALGADDQTPERALDGADDDGPSGFPDGDLADWHIDAYLTDPTTPDPGQFDPPPAWYDHLYSEELDPPDPDYDAMIDFALQFLAEASNGGRPRDGLYPGALTSLPPDQHHLAHDDHDDHDDRARTDHHHVDDDPGSRAHARAMLLARDPHDRFPSGYGQPVPPPPPPPPPSNEPPPF